MRGLAGVYVSGPSDLRSGETYVKFALRLAGVLLLACATSIGLALAHQYPTLGVKKTPSPSPHGINRIWYPPASDSRLILPDGREMVVHSVLNITEPMHFGSFVWDDRQIPAGTVWVRVDLEHQLLSVFRAGHEIGAAVILYGTDGKPTPTGNFTVLAKAVRYYSHAYNAPMPYMLRLTNDGVAIHGSKVQKGWATHGCIGVPLDFARILFSVVSKGDLVVILPAWLQGGNSGRDRLHSVR